MMPDDVGTTHSQLRVIHVVWGAGFAGIERFVCDLARVQASAQQMDVRVLACGAPPDDPSLLRYAAPGVTAVGGGLSSGFDIWSGRLRAIARELASADLIHMHGFTPIVALIAWRMGRPAVFTAHGSLGLDQSRLSTASLKQAAKGLYLRRATSAVACVSEWIGEAARQRYKLDQNRVHVVLDGVDFERIRAQRPRNDILLAEGIEPSAWVVAVTARLVGKKRIDRLLDAAARMRPGAREWALLVAGSGPEENGLRERATALGIGGNVRFLGSESGTSSEPPIWL
jgi:glycosyltransferase involved in cell wall biosynthesis